MTVRVADDTLGRRLTEEDKMTIGGAAQPAIEADENAARTTEDR